MCDGANIWKGQVTILCIAQFSVLSFWHLVYMRGPKETRRQPVLFSRSEYQELLSTPAIRSVATIEYMRSTNAHLCYWPKAAR
jgi:hypothetical protein